MNEVSLIVISSTTDETCCFLHSNFAHVSCFDVKFNPECIASPSCDPFMILEETILSMISMRLQNTNESRQITLFEVQLAFEK